MSLRGRCSFARSNLLALRRLLRRRGVYTERSECAPPRNDIPHYENSTPIIFSRPYAFSRLLQPASKGTGASSDACGCYARPGRVSIPDSFSTGDIDAIFHARPADQHAAPDICIHGNVPASTNIAAANIENAIHAICFA